MIKGEVVIATLMLAAGAVVGAGLVVEVIEDEVPGKTRNACVSMAETPDQVFFCERLKAQMEDVGL